MQATSVSPTKQKLLDTQTQFIAEEVKSALDELSIKKLPKGSAEHPYFVSFGDVIDLSRDLSQYHSELTILGDYFEINFGIGHVSVSDPSRHTEMPNLTLTLSGDNGVVKMWARHGTNSISLSNLREFDPALTALGRFLKHPDRDYQEFKLSFEPYPDEEAETQPELEKLEAFDLDPLFDSKNISRGDKRALNRWIRSAGKVVELVQQSFEAYERRVAAAAARQETSDANRRINALKSRL